MTESVSGEAAMLQWPIIVTREKSAYHSIGERYTLVRLAVSCAKVLTDAKASADVVSGKVGQACLENAFAALGLDPTRQITMKDFLSGLYDDIEGRRDEFFSLLPKDAGRMDGCTVFDSVLTFRDRLLKYAEVENQMRSTAPDQCKTMVLNLIMADISDGDREFTNAGLLTELVCCQVGMRQAEEVGADDEAASEPDVRLKAEDVPDETSHVNLPDEINFKELGNAPFDRNSVSHILTDGKIAIVADSKNIWYSDDLLAWRKAILPEDYDVSYKKMKCENGIFISWAGRTGAYSMDGKSWEPFEFCLDNDDYGEVIDIFYSAESRRWVIYTSVMVKYSRLVKGFFSDSYDYSYYSKPVVLVSDELEGDFTTLDMEFSEGLVLVPNDGGAISGSQVLCSRGVIFVLCRYDSGFIGVKGVSSQKKDMYEVHAYDLKKQVQHKNEFRYATPDVFGYATPVVMAKKYSRVLLWFADGEEESGEVEFKGDVLSFDYDEAMWNKLDEDKAHEFRGSVVGSLFGSHEIKLPNVPDQVFVSLGFSRHVSGAPSLAVTFSTSDTGLQSSDVNVCLAKLNELPPGENPFAVFHGEILLLGEGDGDDGRHVYVGRIE